MERQPIRYETKKKKQTVSGIIFMVYSRDLIDCVIGHNITKLLEMHVYGFPCRTVKEQ